jgi:hypothetical protein
MTILGIFTLHIHVARQGSRWSCHFAVLRNGQNEKHKSTGLPIWTAESRRIAGRGKDAELQKCDFAFLTEATADAIASGGTSLCRMELLHPPVLP